MCAARLGQGFTVIDEIDEIDEIEIGIEMRVSKFQPRRGKTAGW